MIDPRTAKILASLDPKADAKFAPFIEAAKIEALKHGVEYIGISGHRTWKEQNEIYKIGRTKPGRKVTNAKGGQSNHNFGIAVDFGVFQDGKYLDTYNPKLASKVHQAVGKLASVYGIEWGGSWKNFKDEPHFEIYTGLSMSKKRELYLKYNSVL